jgi:hypothetical protein
MATKPGMASVTSLETGVAEPKRIMPAASWKYTRPAKRRLPLRCVVEAVMPGQQT